MRTANIVKPLVNTGVASVLGGISSDVQTKGVATRHETTESGISLRGRNTPSWNSVHMLKYELGSVLRRDSPGYSDLGGGQIYAGCMARLLYGETPGKMGLRR